MTLIKNEPPTQERLKQVVEYDSETGVFRWKLSTGPRVKVGEVTGAAKPPIYGRIQIDGVRYVSSRLAWLYVYGEYPDVLIDHINTDITDNRIVNLRLATSSDNVKNTIVQKESKTGVKGVTYSTSSIGKFEARIGHEGKNYYLGIFNTIEQAKEVLDKKRQELHGEFLNYG